MKRRVRVVVIGTGDVLAWRRRAVEEDWQIELADGADEPRRANALSDFLRRRGTKSGTAIRGAVLSPLLMM